MHVIKFYLFDLRSLISAVVELRPYNLTAAQKSIIVQTHLHLITYPPDLESNSFIPLLTRHSIISTGFSIPTQPPTSRLTLNVTKPRPFTHLAVKLYGSSSTFFPLWVALEHASSPPPRLLLLRESSPFLP